jgi:hypothetical protein
MSAITSGAAAAALTAGLAAGLAVENEQIRPYAEVQRHGAPGPALIEKVEASAGSSRLVTHRVVKTVPDVSGIDGVTVSDVCQSEASPTLDAVLCALSGDVEPLVEPLLAGLSLAD